MRDAVPIGIGGGNDWLTPGGTIIGPVVPAEDAGGWGIDGAGLGLGGTDTL